MNLMAQKEMHIIEDIAWREKTWMVKLNNHGDKGQWCLFNLKKVKAACATCRLFIR